MSRKSFLAILVILLGLPAAFALVSAVLFHLRNPTNGSLVSSGEKREYLLYVPRSYDPSHPTPLVISLHGAGGWPAQQMRVSEWNRLADRERFIVVYPAGARSPGPRIWHAMREPELEKDVRFISDLIAKLEREYTIDRRRIYANGLSNGGGMSFVLSCTLSDRIAAVGLVASAQTLPWRWCTDDRPVPMIAFHGTADPVIPYRGGQSWISGGLFPDISTWASKWALRNRCGTHAIESAIASDVRRREYTHCADDAAVVLYTIEGGGHSWPGGERLPKWLVGPTTHSIDATEEMWRFFGAHPLGRTRPGKETM